MKYLLYLYDITTLQLYDPGCIYLCKLRAQKRDK